VIVVDTKVLDALAEFCMRWPIAGNGLTREAGRLRVLGTSTCTFTAG
jgi:hypothetical protein